MTDFYWDTVEYRKDYPDKVRQQFAKEGKAMPDGSYPIDDAEDLGDAINAVGRGANNSHNAIRRHIIKRADALNLAKEIPDTWKSDGSLKQSNSKRPRHRNTEYAQALSRNVLPQVRNVNVESRNLTVDDSDKYVIIRGMPIIYDEPYEVRDQYGTFQETVRPGVMRDVINDTDIVFLLNHQEHALPLARNNMSMTLEDRSDGLHFEARMNKRQTAANDLAVAIEEGNVNQMSVTFVPDKQNGGDHWNEDMTQRSISRFKKVYDISAVTWPANPATSLEIAQRMAMTAPIDMARTQEMAAEIRAGKMLSSATQARLVDAWSSIHSILMSGGYEFEKPEIIDPDNDGDDDTFNDDAVNAAGEVEHTVHEEDITTLSDGADGDGHDSIEDISDLDVPAGSEEVAPPVDTDTDDESGEDDDDSASRGLDLAIAELQALRLRRHG